MTELAHVPVAFRPGTRLPQGIDNPQVINQVIAPLMHGGEGTAQDIVDVASDPASPIHAAFTWDDEEAGAKHRLMEAFHLAGSLIDTRTGERVYTSRYAETNDRADIGRIRVNVRTLPTSDEPAQRQTYTVRARQITSIVPIADAPDARPVEAIGHTPEQERSIAVFRRWVDAHKHDPAVLQEAIRLLYDAL